MASVATPPPAARPPASASQQKKDTECQTSPRTQTPPPTAKPAVSPVTAAAESKLQHKKENNASASAPHVHPGTPIFATPPMLDPFHSRKAFTLGLRDMIHAMGSYTSTPATPQLPSDSAALHSNRPSDLAAFYVPLQGSGTPALRDLYVGPNFDVPVPTEFDQDRSAEMQALFTACVSSSMDMGNIGLGNMPCMSPAFSMHPANVGDGRSGPGDMNNASLSLLSSPELGNDNSTGENSSHPASAALSALSGGNSSSTVASAVSDAVSPSIEHLQLNTSAPLIMPSGVLPTSALSETLTPIVGTAARTAETRKRQRVVGHPISKLDRDQKRTINDDRKGPLHQFRRSATLQPAQRINSQTKATSAAPIRIATTQTKAHPLVRARGSFPPTAARSLTSLIPLPVPVGISAPVGKGGNDIGDRALTGAGAPVEAQKMTRAMVWVGTPHGPTLLPIELVTANGLAHHTLTPYGLMPMFPQQNLTPQQLQQTRNMAAGVGQIQQPSTVMDGARTAKGIVVAPGTSSSTASDYLDNQNSASYVPGEGGIGRKRRRRAGADDSVCSAEQARHNRAKAMIRLKQKKAVRSYEKTVRYGVRKRIAMVRPRVNGRFATKLEVEEWKRNGRHFEGSGSNDESK